MQKKFISNLALLLFLNFLVKPFWLFGVEVGVQNEVGAEDYGFYYTLFNFSLLLNILLDVGINNFNNRNIAQNNQLVSKHFSKILPVKFMLGGVYLAGSLAAGLAIGYNTIYLKFLALFCLNQFMASMMLYLRSNFAGLLIFRTDSVLSVLDRTLMIGICSVLLWGSFTDTPFQIEWFIYAQTISYSAATIIAFVLLLRKTTNFKLNIDIPFAMVILKQSFPFALLILLMTFYYRVDAVMLERLLPDGKTQSGIYAQAFRVLDAANIIGYLFAGLLLPIFSNMLKRKEDVTSVIGLAVRLLVVPAFAMAIWAFFYKEEFMSLLYVAHSEMAAPIFGLLMVCFIPVAVSYIFGTLLTANGSLKQLNRIAFVGMILNVILNFWLIPIWQATGAAVASLVTQLLTALLQVGLSYKLFRFNFTLLQIAKMTGFIAIGGGVGWWIEGWDTEWYIRGFVLIGVFVSLSFILRLIDLRSIYRILRYD